MMASSSAPGAVPVMAHRDGTEARAGASDGADWRAIRSADGHSYWFPPEAAFLAVEGMPWTQLEALLRQALAERAHANGPGGRSRKRTPPKKRGPKPVKLQAVKEAIRTDIQGGNYSLEALGRMMEKELAARYKVSRDTARSARDAVCRELSGIVGN